MSRLRNRQLESKLTFSRVLVVISLFIALFSLLLGRVYQLQIIQHTQLLELAQKNKTKDISLMPYRSDIIDRYGLPLAYYHTTYHLTSTQDYLAARLPNEQQYALSNLGLSEQLYPNKKIGISANLYAYIKNHPIDGISVNEQISRYYPYPESFSHLVGYTSVLPNSTVQYHDPKLSFMEGKTGVEQVFDHYIRGNPGLQRNLIDAKQLIYQSEAIQEPKRSMPLQLTIDRELQNYIYDQINSYTGSVIVLNPNNGEILAAVSTPSFNTNTLDNVSQHGQGAMFNRYLQALYPPASIIKPFIAINALEDGLIDPDEVIQDPGFYQITPQSKPFRNYKRTGHGSVNLKKSIVVSNDTYFYALAHKLGIDKITDYLDNFKFGHKTNLGLPNESSGIIPDKQYRKKHYKKWFSGQTIITGIGQGDVLCTPLQIARATMLLANGGTDYPLHIVPQYILPSPKIHYFQSKHREHIIDAMVEVPISGTAKSIGQTPYQLAAKTGSAQVASLDEQSDYHKLPKHQKDHHLLIGFAPAKSPELTIVVVIEHQHEATHIAHKILDWCWVHNRFSKSTPNPGP